MKKHSMLIIPLFFVMLSMISTACSSNRASESKKEHFSFQEEDISMCEKDTIQMEDIVVMHNGTQAIITVKDSQIPVVDVLEACGICFSWIDEGIASFVLNDVTYILDCKARSIHEENDSFNWIQVAPGTEHALIHATTNNILVDSTTMKSILFLLDIDAVIKSAD